MTYIHSQKWVDKLNEDCESKNKQFGSVKWKLCDIEFNPKYDEPEDVVRNYCYQSYKDFTLCYSCDQNRVEYISAVMLPTKYKTLEEKMRYIEKFLCVQIS